MPAYSKRPILLLLDWDGTLTTASTLPLIASITTLPGIHPRWKDLSAAYSEDLARHDTAYVWQTSRVVLLEFTRRFWGVPQKNDRTTVKQELTYLSSLQDTERISIERVEASGIFNGVRTSDIEVAATKTFRDNSITLRTGWIRLIQSIQQDHNGTVAIVSVAWSELFIATLVAEANRAAGSNGVAVHDIVIKANDIAEDGSGRLDRYFPATGQGIWTAADKDLVMDQLVYQSNRSESGGGAVKPFTIYVGDSPTDLACLLKADVGICIRDSPLTSEQKALQETLQRLSVGCVSVNHFADMADALEREDAKIVARGLWWAKDFEEVCESGVLDWREPE